MDLDQSKTGFNEKGLDFLGVYHEHHAHDFSFRYLEEKGCELLGRSLQELKRLGLALLAQLIHPEDFQRCATQLLTFKADADQERLVCFYRVALPGLDDFQLFVTSITKQPNTPIFTCLTSPVTQLQSFEIQVENVLDSASYKKEHQSIYDALTKREKEIIALVCQGKSTTEIAASLFLSTHTVNQHRKNANAKTQFESRSELIQFALNFELI